MHLPSAAVRFRRGRWQPRRKHHATNRNPQKHSLQRGPSARHPICRRCTRVREVPDILLLARHIHGDWGDLNGRDCLQNELAVLLDLRILSRYVLPTGSIIWIVTEADRSATTIFLFDDG
jgi:hypothetical protein